MIYVILLFILGMALSAFFSGSETGFYRVTRVRLVLDGLGGDWIARSLLWLTNNPTLFVATTLIGNNLANYLTSLSIVIGTSLILGGNSYLAEMFLPIALAPFVFVYGELMPKNLFYAAPNMLLRNAPPKLWSARAGLNGRSAAPRSFQAIRKPVRSRPFKAFTCLSRPSSMGGCPSFRSSATHNAISFRLTGSRRALRGLSRRPHGARLIG